MEQQLPNEELEQKVLPDKKKRLYLLAFGGAILLVLVVILASIFIAVAPPKSESEIAPEAGDLLNPLDFQASILFSTLYIETKPGTTVKNDVEVMTFSDGTISGGTIAINFDRNQISDIKVTPVSGSTGFLPDATFSNIQYNPDNVTFSFDTPTGTQASTGRGRIAEIEFTVRDDAFSDVELTVDLDRSSLYSNNGEASNTLRTGSSNLQVKLIPTE